MKKILLVTLTIGSLLLWACGSDNSADISTGNENADELVAKAFKEMSGIEKAQNVLQEGYGLSLKDITPNFDYLEQNAKGKDYFYGDNGKGKRVTAVFVRKDGGEIDGNEYKAYVQRVFNLIKSKAQDGKIIKGFDGDAETLEAAMQELTFEQIFQAQYDPSDFGFRMNNQFYACSVSLEEAYDENPAHIKFYMGLGLQKSLKESMQEAEKILENSDVQKTLKEKLNK